MHDEKCLTVSLLRAMPADMQARTFAEWDLETNVAKTALLNFAIPDEIGSAFDRHVESLNDLRTHPPEE
jgi:hypothetical protein